MKPRVLLVLAAASLVVSVVACTPVTASPTATSAPPTPVAVKPSAPPPTLTLVQPSPTPLAYPTKPLNFIVGFAAGGSSDLGSRLVAAAAEKRLGQQIMVVNRAGAGGQVGWTELAGAKPDGYTIGLISFPAANTIMLDPERKATFTIDSFELIINTVLDRGAVYVKANSPYRNLQQLIDDAKKRPDQVRAAASGILSQPHLALLALEDVAGIRLRTVQFDGSAPAMTALLGDNVDAVFDNVGAWAPRVKEGELRVLAVLDRERSKFLPNVPTSLEQGYPGVLSSSARGIAAPKGTPDSIVKRLQAAIRQSLEDPETVDKMEKMGLAIKIMVGDEYPTYFKEVHETTRKLVQKWLASQSK